MVPGLEKQLLVCAPQMACHWGGQGGWEGGGPAPPPAAPGLLLPPLSLAPPPHLLALPLACRLAPGFPEGLPLTRSQHFL